MADYPPANCQYDSWPKVIQFIQVCYGYANMHDMELHEASLAVWQRWYQPRFGCVDA